MIDDFLNYEDDGMLETIEYEQRLLNELESQYPHLEFINKNEALMEVKEGNEICLIDLDKQIITSKLNKVFTWNGLFAKEI